ncbi:MAG TPA: hypothetical protein VF092_06890 [Longimicrobium sp.]
MRIRLALTLAAAAVLGACAQSPTASIVTTAPRFDGGNGLGSGNVTGTGDGGTTTTTTGTTTTTSGPNTMGAGH